jgi:hypothetical protein
MIRNQLLLWVLSVGFELMEVRFGCPVGKEIYVLFAHLRSIKGSIFAYCDFAAYFQTHVAKL